MTRPAARAVRHIVRTAAACLLLGLLAACATRNTTVLRHDLATRAVCCASYAEMHFVPLTADETELTLGAGSPIFEFPEGRSYFGAYRLPAGPSPGIVFRSYMLGAMFPDVNVLFPSFVFLDADHRVVSVVHDAPMANPDRGTHWDGQLRIPPSAAYLVVYTTDSRHPTVRAFSENGTPWEVPGSLSGVVRVAVSR
jgi:hypothetical protein